MTSWSSNDSNNDRVEKAPPWLLSFADVSALLLAFFVMLFSMSTLKTEEYEKVISKITRAQEEKIERQVAPVAEKAIETVSIQPAEAPEYLQRVLEEKFSTDPFLSTAKVVLLDDRVVLSLPSDELFLSGSAIINSNAERPLFNLAGVLSQFGNQVVVEGHTDTQPTKGDIYPTNWELSLARALSVATYLNDVGYEGKFSIMGHASGHYKHLNAKIPETKRKSLARRVDLVIYPEAGDQ